MTSPHQSVDPEVEARWRGILTHGKRGRWAFLPANPRCMFCQQPFKGVGGALLRSFTGYRPSNMSPNMCNACEISMPRGGAEVDVAVLFADLRGSTIIGAAMTPSEYAALLNRFYHAASNVLIAAQSWIDNLLGDEIMALYVPGMGPDYRKRAVLAGVGLLHAVGYGRGQEPWLRVGCGVHAGQAFVGKVGTAGVNQVTALGDTVNTAARIQAQAGPGELLIGDDLYQSVADLYPDLERRSLTVRGKDELVGVRVLRPAER
jgi:adenylate cyclase